MTITYDPKSHEDILQGISVLTDTLNAIANPPDILNGCASILNILSQVYFYITIKRDRKKLPYCLGTSHRTSGCHDNFSALYGILFFCCEFTILILSLAVKERIDL